MATPSAPAAVLQRGIYRNRFGWVRQAVPIVLDATAEKTAPATWGAQTALVVGLENVLLSTDRDHRIKGQLKLPDLATGWSKTTKKYGYEMTTHTMNEAKVQKLGRQEYASKQQVRLERTE